MKLKLQSFTSSALLVYLKKLNIAMVIFKGEVFSKNSSYHIFVNSFWILETFWLIDWSSWEANQKSLKFKKVCQNYDLTSFFWKYLTFLNEKHLRRDSYPFGYQRKSYLSILFLTFLQWLLGVFAYCPSKFPSNLDEKLTLSFGSFLLIEIFLSIHLPIVIQCTWRQ